MANFPLWDYGLLETMGKLGHIPTGGKMVRWELDVHPKSIGLFQNLTLDNIVLRTKWEFGHVLHCAIRPDVENIVFPAIIDISSIITLITIIPVSGPLEGGEHLLLCGNDEQ